MTFPQLTICEALSDSSLACLLLGARWACMASTGRVMPVTSICKGAYAQRRLLLQTMTFILYLEYFHDRSVGSRTVKETFTSPF